MTPTEIELAYKGYRIRKKEEWEMVRVASYYSCLPHYKKFVITDIHLPIDVEEGKKRLTPDMIMKVRKLSDG